MKITGIRLVGLRTINLPIFGALPSDPYQFKGADGFGPPVVNVSFSKSRRQGQRYNGREPQGRELLIKIGLNPNYSIGQTPDDLRTDLYGLFTPASGELIVAQFLNDGTIVAVTNGTVSKFESDHFSKDPSVQITIPCLEAYLQAPVDTSVPLPLDKSAPIIENLGTVATGIRVNVTFTANVGTWTLTDASGKKMTINYPFQTGDRLAINTVPGSRSIMLTRSTTTINLLPYLTFDSEWLYLYGGGNRLLTSSQNFIWNSFVFRAQYLGV